MSDATYFYEGLVQGGTPVTTPYVFVTITAGAIGVAAQGAGHGILVDPGGGATGDSVVVAAVGPCNLLLNSALAAGVWATSRGTDGAGEAAATGDQKLARILKGAAAAAHAKVYLAASPDIAA